MLPIGIMIIVPWLFRIKLFSELTYIIIYPFVLVKNSRFVKVKTNTFDLYNNQMLIMIRQAEEIFQVSFFIFLLSGLTSGLWIVSLLAFSIYLLLYVWFFIQFRKRLRKSKGFAKHNRAFYLAWFLSDTPLFTEAYANCNFPTYLYKRNIFAWFKYH
jgi:hypothetical protein